MDGSGKSKGKPIYIQEHILPLVRNYAKENHLKEGQAVNKIIAAYLSNSSNEDNLPATKRDIKRLIRRVETGHQINERTFLELLEATGFFRHMAGKDPEISKRGKVIREHFAKLISDIREMQ